MSRIATILAQVLLISFISFLGMEITSFFAIPIPGSLLGMFILFALLSTGVVKVEWFEEGSSLLIGELLLFFIPSAIGIIQYTNLFGSTGALLLGVVILSIVTVLLSIVFGTVWITNFKRRGYKVW